MKNKAIKKITSITLSTITAISYMAISAAAVTSVNCETDCGGASCRGNLTYESGRNRAYIEGYIGEDPTRNTLLIDATVRAGYKIPTSSNLVYTTKKDSSSAGGIRVTNTPISNGTFSTATGTIKFTVNTTTTGNIGLGPISSR